MPRSARGADGQPRPLRSLLCASDIARVGLGINSQWRPSPAAERHESACRSGYEGGGLLCYPSPPVATMPRGSFMWRSARAIRDRRAGPRLQRDREQREIKINSTSISGGAIGSSNRHRRLCRQRGAYASWRDRRSENEARPAHSGRAAAGPEFRRPPKLSLTHRPRQCRAPERIVTSGTAGEGRSSLHPRGPDVHPTTSIGRVRADFGFSGWSSKTTDRRIRIPGARVSSARAASSSFEA